MSYFLVDRLLKTKVRYPDMAYREKELLEVQPSVNKNGHIKLYTHWKIYLSSSILLAIKNVFFSVSSLTKVQES